MFLGGFLGAAGLFAIPISLLGAVSIWFAIRSARGRASAMPLAIGAIFSTVIVGALGTVMGAQMALEHLATLAVEKRFLILIGIKEAMNDLVLSLFFALAAIAVLSFGAYRARTKASPVTEADPVRV